MAGSKDSIYSSSGIVRLYLSTNRAGNTLHYKENKISTNKFVYIRITIVTHGIVKAVTNARVTNILGVKTAISRAQTQI